RRFVENAAKVHPAGLRATVWNPRVDGMPVDQSHPVAKAIGLQSDALSQWLSRHPYNLSPVSDDSPFFWHFVRFRDVIRERRHTKDLLMDPEDSKGERVLLVLLVVTVLFSAIFLLLPLLLLRDV